MCQIRLLSNADYGRRAVALISLCRYTKNKLESDIGLIRMSSPVQYTNNINPVCLSQTGSPFVGTDSIVQGWGDTKFGAKNGSNSLREVHVRQLTDIVTGISDGDTMNNILCFSS